MEDNYSKILGEGFGLRYHGGNRIRTGYLCKTDKGPRELKNVPPKKDAIQFEHDVKEHLFRQGFQNISRFCLAKDGRPYFQLEQNTYVLERPIEGQPMDEECFETFLYGVEALARLHQAGRGVHSAAKRSNLRELPAICSKRKNELLRIKKRIDRQSGYGALDVLVMQNYSYYLECIEEAQRLFNTAGYQKAMQGAEKALAVCHNAFKGENIRKNEKAQIFVTGFNKCAYDSPMTDLSAYLRRCVKKSTDADGGVKTALYMVERYHERIPITAGDMDALIGNLFYPEKFLRLMNEYYNKRQVCVSPAMRERLDSCIAAQKKNDRLIGEIYRNFSH